MKRVLCLLVFTLSIPLGFEQATAQSTRPDTVVGPLKEGWESIDQRLVFLTVRLSSIESSIDGVNEALIVAGFQKNAAATEADHVRGANDAMDQNGGGPLPWQTFYGNTAEKFFYHPTDANTLHVNPEPIAQRPPQLDYIYKANSNTGQRDNEAARGLGKKIDELLARRRQLQEQQSELWCRISFRAIATRNISLKPLLRFDVTKAGSDPTDLQRVNAIRSGAKFVRTIDQLLFQAQTAVQGHQSAVVEKLQNAIDTAHADMMKNLEDQQFLANDLSDSHTEIGIFAAAAQHVADSSANITESYRLIREGLRLGNEQESQTFRAQLQQSYLDLAASLYTAEQSLASAAAGWKVVPDTTHPGSPVSADLGVNGNTGQDSLDTSDRATIRGTDQDPAVAGAIDTDARDPDVKVEDGWTILFRSNDPLLFNTPVLNATSYSVAMSNAPAATKWVRFKRMDTGSYVIFAMTASGLVNNGDAHSRYWWRGDKRINHSACNLGIVDQTMPANGNTLMAMEGEGNFTGWGFCETKDGDRQQYVWGGAAISQTVFEIAVTDEDLSPEDQRQVIK